ncbi:MAG: hypothetical protein ACE5ES_01020 [Candidatus Nanoarchaeia archaeon]
MNNEFIPILYTEIKKFIDDQLPKAKEGIRLSQLIINTYEKVIYKKGDSCLIEVSEQQIKRCIKNYADAGYCRFENDILYPLSRGR